MLCAKQNRTGENFIGKSKPNGIVWFARNHLRGPQTHKLILYVCTEKSQLANWTRKPICPNQIELSFGCCIDALVRPLHLNTLSLIQHTHIDIELLSLTSHHVIPKIHHKWFQFCLFKFIHSLNIWISQYFWSIEILQTIKCKVSTSLIWLIYGVSHYKLNESNCKIKRWAHFFF